MHHRTVGLFLALLAIQPALARAQAPEVSVGDTVVTEIDGGTSAALFTVSLSDPPPPGSAVTVPWWTEGCTATAGSDYLEASGLLSFPPEEPLTRTVSVTVPGDGVTEGLESFGLVLGPPVDATLGDGRGDAAILDDAAPVPPPFAVGDFNGDGRSDLLVAYAALDGRPPSRNIVWAMSGPLASPLDELILIAGGWSIAGVADLDGDGDPDLLWRHSDGGLTFNLSDAGKLRAPDFGNAQPEPAETGPDSVVVGLADFGDDPQADVLLWRPATGELSIWYLDGTSVGRTGPTVPGTEPDTDWRPVATGDFDGDGQSDILWRHAITGALRIWRMSGPVEIAVDTPVPDAVSDLNWEIVATGDFNGDGHDDLLWQHRLSERLVVWFLDGKDRICGGFLSPDRLDLPGWGEWKITGPR